MSGKVKRKKYLVFSPHPDDVDFGCSGTVAKFVEEGSEAVYCIITDGSKGSHKVHKAGKKGRIIHTKKYRTEDSEIILLLFPWSDKNPTR